MSELGRRLIDARTIAMLRELEAEAAPAPWANRYHRKHVTTADWKHYLPILAECDTFENGDFIAEARNHLTALLDEIERLQASLKTAHDELLRVRTRGHGAAHELDNIAVEAGLGANPQPGAVAAYVRALRDVVWLSQGGREPGGGRAMMDLTKWLRLYKIDPELKPPGLEHNPGGVAAPEDPDGAKTLPVWTISCEGIAIDPGPGDEWKQDEDDERDLVSIIPNQAAAALIRDRAVWHLARFHPDKSVLMTTSGSGQASVQWNDDHEGWLEFNADDPTEALYLACCKVLGVEP